MSRISKRFDNLKLELLSSGKLHPVDLGGDYKKTVIVVGSARSGTTWLSEIINYQNDFRLIFEPFHHKKNRDFLDCRSRQYIRPGDTPPGLLDATERVLSGRINNPAFDKHNKKIFARKRIVKDIRIHLMLKWINDNFSEIPIIFLLRHPYSVAFSRLSLGWDDYLGEFLAQEDLLHDFLLPYTSEIDVINNGKSPFLKAILQWCIENYVPLRQISCQNLCLIKYEDVMHNPDKEIKKVFDYLGVEYKSSVLNNFKLPSGTSRKFMQHNPIECELSSISANELSAADRILRKFNFSSIYNSNHCRIK